MIAKVFVDGARKNNIEVIAVCSRQLENAKNFAKECQIRDYYDNYEEMLKNDEIDFIYVATPNGVHHDYCKKALLASKHVMCEKPFCANARELKELVSIAKERSLYLFEAIINIHLPHFKVLKENLSKIGRLKIVQTNFSQYSSKYNALLEGQLPNVFNPRFAGGALLDLNIYNIHIAVSLFGKPKEINYVANCIENGIDVSGVLILKYEDFIFSSVGAKDCKTKSFVSIQGEKGTLYSPSSPSVLSSIELITDKIEVTECQPERNGMYYELLDFNQVYTTEDLKTCYHWLDKSVQVMEIADEARKKANIVFTND